MNELAFKCSELSADFSADDGVLTFKSSELCIEPVVNKVSTPLAKGTADFLVDDGVLTREQPVSTAYLRCPTKLESCAMFVY